MAQLLTFRLADPQNALDTYGAGALIRVERDTVATFATASEITTIAIVAGTTEYEYRDQTGVAGTHYGRWRLSKASPSVAADYSGYLGSYQYGALSGEVISLETAKAWLGIADTDDDPWLPIAIGAINRTIVRTVGIDLGPSPDTTRRLHGRDATEHGTHLWVAGGIRAFTTVEFLEGSTWVDVSTDIMLAPEAWEKPPDQPYSRLAFVDQPTTRSRFPSGIRDVRVTGTAFQTFGWDAWPDDIVQVANVALQRCYAERNAGGMVTESTVSRYIKWDNETLLAYRRLYFPMAA